jgi:hypothetical protein
MQESKSKVKAFVEGLQKEKKVVEDRLAESLMSVQELNREKTAMAEELASKNVQVSHMLNKVAMISP